MSHALKRDPASRLSRSIPFGLGEVKPRHFRDMAKILWENRDNLPYAYKVLTRGVCDGCALGVAGLHDWTINGVHLCMTRLNLLRLNTMPEFNPEILQDVSQFNSFDNQQLRQLGRLACPMVRKKGERGFQRVTWPEAQARLGARLRKTDPQRMAFFVTARGVTNEVYYVAQKVARFLGTNNIDNAARLCHAPSTAAMKFAIGVSASTCSYKDWYGTDLVLFFGSNPANDQPVATKYLHEAKQLGTKVILINPYLEPGMQRYWVPSSASSALFGTDIADYWFPVAQGGDIAFISGVLKVMIERGWCDEQFIQQHTLGFDALVRQLQQLDWPQIEKQSGLPRASMIEFAGLIHHARTAVLVWSMGITQHAYGADAVQMVLNLGLSKGFVGREKCGLMPIRGHSSVQGGAEMGAYSTAFPGGRAITSENVEELSRAYGFPVPDWAGLTTPEMIEAAGQGQLDLLYSLGGNFLRTLPEPQSVRAALSKVPVRIHQDIILTDQMFIEPGEEVWLLPAKTRYEQEGGGIETTTERRIAFSPEIPRQLGECKAEWRILLDLASAAWPEKAHLLGCASAQAIRNEIARIVPFYDGIQNLQTTGDAIQYGGPHLCANGQFPTPDGKAHFRPVPLPNLHRESNEFELSTRRGKQFNTLIYAEVDPLNGASRDAVLISAEDAQRLDLSSNQRVRLKNDLGEYIARVMIAPIAPGNVQVHWPEGNHLIRKGVTDQAGGVPDYNARVQIEKVP
ncbi:MAG: FdhF/YdeP family oxidoreductase [Verrucomicrobiota bacterium]|nr:FdhF/YdeP family oxidoreductase [Verrucomicrobiota bacterium]